MEFKGTKGKWSILKGTTIIINEFGSEIWDYSGYRTTEYEDDANALLISKAPEMLEMLNNFYNNMKIGRIPSNALSNLEKLIKEATEL